MSSEVIPAAVDGERLDRLVAMVAGCSRSEATESVRAGHVLLDGEAATRPSLRVRAGQTIEVPTGLGDPPALPVGDAGVAYGLAHVDDDVIVVDKPAGLVVHPGAGNPTGTLVQGLLEAFPEIAGVGDPQRPGIVHRLDKGTSGLLVVARTAEAHARLSEAMAEHSVGRRYVALSWGVPEHRRGMVDAPLARSTRDPTRIVTSAAGRPARTLYEVREAFTRPAPCALLDCTLETGRTHQIRVHLLAIGHPVVGDPRYGKGTGPFGLQRPFLHAAGLAFEHPISGDHIELESPLPPDLTDVLSHLEP